MAHISQCEATVAQTEQEIITELKRQTVKSATKKPIVRSDSPNRSRYSSAIDQLVEIRTPQVHDGILKFLTKNLEKIKAYRVLIDRVKEEATREVDELFERKAS